MFLYKAICFLKTTEEVDHRAIHTTYQELTCKTKLNLEERKGLQIVRQNIDDFTYLCRSNVLVNIYISGHSAEIRAGKEENKLKISIYGNGEVEYKWTKRTWSKLLIDTSLPLVVFPSKIYGLVQDKMLLKAGNFIKRFFSTSAD